MLHHKSTAHILAFLAIPHVSQSCADCYLIANANSLPDGPHGFTFNLTNVNRVNNATWFNYLIPDTPFEQDMKGSLRQVSEFLTLL